MMAGKVAAALGGEAIGADRVLAPGPGHSPKDRSLSVTLAGDDFVVNSFAGDDWRACRDYVKERLGLDPQRVRTRAGDSCRQFCGPATTHSDNGRVALAIWDRATDPRGTVVERYLAGRELSLDGDISGRVLRYSAEPLNGERLPAMIALYRDIVSDEPRAIQRTWLTPDGRKIERRMLGPVKGCAVKVDADENVTHGLHIAEGVETALAARQMGFLPCWAVGSAGAIASFPVLEGVEAITVCGENDDNGANARAVRECADRWFDAGRDVFVIEPRTGGDLADVWKAVAR